MHFLVLIIYNLFVCLVAWAVILPNKQHKTIGFCKGTNSINSPVCSLTSTTAQLCSHNTSTVRAFPRLFFSSLFPFLQLPYERVVYVVRICSKLSVTACLHLKRPCFYKLIDRSQGVLTDLNLVGTGAPVNIRELICCYPV